MSSFVNVDLDALHWSKHTWHLPLVQLSVGMFAFIVLYKISCGPFAGVCIVFVADTTIHPQTNDWNSVLKNREIKKRRGKKTEIVSIFSFLSYKKNRN